MKRTILLTLGQLALALGTAQLTNAQTTAFTYQGKLIDDCCPATGLYDLVFRLYDGAGPGPGGQQGSPVALPRVPVTNGLFTVSLDFGSAPFTGARRWLQIDTRTNNPAFPFVTLLPRTELTPTPYALHAVSAGSVLDNTITRAKIASGQVVKSLNGLTDAISLVAGNNVTLTPNGSTLSIASTGGGAFSLNGSSAYYNGGNVGIGTASPLGKLHLTGGAAIFDRPSGAIRVTRTAGELSANDLGIWNSVGGGGDTFSIADWQSGTKGLFVNTSSGAVGIGTSDPESQLEVQGGDIHIYGGGGRLYFQGGPRDPYYLLETYPTPDAAGMRLLGYSGVKLTTGQGDIVNVEHDKVGIGTANPQVKLDVAGTIRATGGVIGESIGVGYGRGVFGLADGDASSYGGLFQYGTDGNNAAYLGGNGVAADFYGPVFVNGVATVRVLTITGGADLAEPFQMSGDKVSEGSVVVIDDEHPGQLKRSDRAYDNRVAGIISGANGVHPGITLKQEGKLEGTQNVALTGRVYALADASEGPIKPGDLLTSSATPGHLMKATDREQSQGAIVGKAMSGLSEGKGHVLVLVNLQ